MQRLKTIIGHLNPEMAPGRQGYITSPTLSSTAASRPRPVRPDDVVVVSALRTAIGKAKRGSFKDTYPDELLAHVLRATLKQNRIDPSLIGDIAVGNVRASGSGALLWRIAQFQSGIPEEVPISAVNRQCASGLQAFINIAGGIKLGSYDIGIAAGVETMSKHLETGPAAEMNPKLFETGSDKERDCTMPMGQTSENVAKRFGIGRRVQDQMALESQTKALKATKEGKFMAEIVPMTVKMTDKNGIESVITVAKDDGIRPTTLENLAKLRPAFAEDGSSTAGNSSQMSDGAAAVLTMTQAKAQSLGLPVLGVLVSYAVVGVTPDIMGVGPAYAIPEALKKAGLTVDDIDLFEINEAFASQAYYCVDKLRIPMEKVNVNGGAIALGHPLGATGCRMIATLLHEMKRRGKRSYGIVSMCMGTGMGAAAVFYYPGN